MKWNVIVFGMIIVGLLLLTGCTSTVDDVKTEENVGETVAVKGTVKSPIKIGDLSGYTLVDETGSIIVASKDLPEEGEEVVARGELKKEVLIGYYIDLNE
ncbi:MAG: hypothetical protein ACQESE_03480 [Nanobdellota archaeon]